MPKINSKQKGNRGEREAAKYLKDLGFNARRTAQYNGRDGECGDVVLEDSGLTIEVKRTKWDSMDRGELDEWLEQMREEGSICILWRPDGKKWRLGYVSENGMCWVVGDWRHKGVILKLIEERKF